MNVSEQVLIGAVGQGELAFPAVTRGIVVLPHVSDNYYVALRGKSVVDRLVQAGFATLLFDLLTEEEGQAPALRSDIDLLSRRLEGAVHWVDAQANLSELPIGLFGEGAGAAAAIEVAAELPHIVSAVVLCGGRPDLAFRNLRQVSAPTLFIVGSLDADGLQVNRRSMESMAPTTIRSLEPVEGATHLFEEPGTMDRVAELATAWFERYASGVA